MKTNLNDEDKSRIAAAAQAVVNVRVMREMGEMVAKINAEERLAKRISRVAVLMIVVLLLLAMALIWNKVQVKGPIREVSLSTSDRAYFERMGAAMRELSQNSCQQLPSDSSGKLTISLQIAPLGQFGNVRVRHASGNTAFDASVVAALRTIQPGPSAAKQDIPSKDMEIIEELLIQDGQCDIALTLDVLGVSGARRRDWGL